jgi:ABC-2 type transport system ATP-binding protein
MMGLALALGTALSACGESTVAPATADGGDNPPVAAGTPRIPVEADRAGTSYRQEITSPITGDSVVFQVFEPAQLSVGQSYPLVLHGHGYGGSRDVTPSEFQQRLIDAGYYVISIDERGFGESGGTVRSMSPDFEGQNLIAILDWAEDLEGLRRRANGEMMVGSYGGSYGGMYQLLLAAADPKHRLRVTAPDITPHDLTYALNPNNVVKSGYGLALATVGEGGGPLFVLIGGGVALPEPHVGLRQDEVIYESLLNAVLSNSFSEASNNMFRYHSVRYFCDGVPAGPQPFLVATPDPLSVPPTPFPQMDVLLTQGLRDTLFNLNDASKNLQCLRQAGGDVRLLTHESGHILPLSLTSVPLPPGSNLEDALDPFYAAVTAPNFQDSGGDRNCGSLVLDDVQFAWFEEKLQGKAGTVNTALPTGQDVCLSLGTDDAISTHQIKTGGMSFDIDNSTPQFSSALGVGGAALGNGAREALLATQTLFTAPAGGAIIAGLPTMALNMVGLSGGESEACPTPLNLAACDPILLLAIGHRKAGATRFDIIDDQLTPVRGFGEHVDLMSGIAERLAEGDELALLVYGFHAQYPVTWSRDVFVPALDLSGSISLPILDSAEIVREGV